MSLGRKSKDRAVNKLQVDFHQSFFFFFFSLFFDIKPNSSSLLFSFPFFFPPNQKQKSLKNPHFLKNPTFSLKNFTLFSQLPTLPFSSLSTLNFPEIQCRIKSSYFPLRTGTFYFFSHLILLE